MIPEVARASLTPALPHKDWRWWLPAMFALVAAILLRDPFVGDWDAFDYTVLSVQGHPSSMALGRMFFIFPNHLAWRAAHAVFNLQPADARLLFQGLVIAQVPLAVIACQALARAVTRSNAAGVVAGWLVATSPLVIFYGGQVMTEIPALWWTAIALLLIWRGAERDSTIRYCLGAAMLGAGANLRETIAFYGVWLIVAPYVAGWRLSRRNILRVAMVGGLFAICVGGLFLAWYAANVNAYRAAWHNWLATMRDEAARHPFTLHNLANFIVFFILASPAVFFLLPFAARSAQRRANNLTPALALAATGILADLLLLFNYSTVINVRYFLGALPALVPLCAAWLANFWQRKTERAERIATESFLNGGIEHKVSANPILYPALCILAVFALVAILLAPTWRVLRAQRESLRAYQTQLSALPRDAVIMAGAQTVTINYWRGLGAGAWETLGTGSGWAGDELPALIKTKLRTGKRVFLDAHPRNWAICGWQAQETRALPVLENHFRFRRRAQMVYELYLPDDAMATDAPALETLLPQNRPADARQCPPTSGS